MAISAASLSSEGARPAPVICACCVFFQLSLTITSEPSSRFSWIIGSASGSETPKLASDGPRARTPTRFDVVPVTMKPADYDALAGFHSRTARNI